jgi:subtilisin family serine protease
MILVVLAVAAPMSVQHGPDPPSPQDPTDPDPPPTVALSAVQPAQVVAILSVTDLEEARRGAQEIAARLNARVRDVYGLFSMEATLAVFDVAGPADVAAAAIRKDPRVIDADVNTMFETQTDPLVPRQYALRASGAERAHAGGLTGRGVVVAVVDAGLDLLHEDLREAVFAHETYIEGSAQVTPDTHGTEVAGVIGARRNGLGIVGVAAESRLVALQACTPKQPGASESTCTAHRVARGVDASVRHRARVANVSVGGPSNRVVNRIVAAVLARGIAVVAAAGNNGPDGPRLYPAALPGVLAVGATGPGGEVYARSNMRAHVAVLAPGVDLLTTRPENRYVFATGTSYAAAVVTGAMALLMQATPDLPSVLIVAALKSASVREAPTTAGRLDICRSLSFIGRADACR